MEPAIEEAMEILAVWDYETAVDSAGAALFYIFIQKLLEHTFSDDMSPEFAGMALGTHLMARKVLVILLDEPHNAWFDRQDTPDRENRDTLLVAAFEDGISACQKWMGKDPETWAWGKLHTLKLTHPFGLLPLLGRSWRIGTVGRPGANHTVNANYFIAGKSSFPVVAGAASRLVVDLANPGGAWFNCSTGISGEPGSPYFKNLSAPWQEDAYFWTKRSKDPAILQVRETPRLFP